MKALSLVRTATLVLSFAALGAPAFAGPGGDHYARLLDMKLMDANRDAMISKDEFLAMIGQLWDMKAGEMKAKDGKLTGEQLLELERVLGRTLDFHTASSR